MATASRIYLVADTQVPDAVRLVRAVHPSHALRHVADSAFSVRVASQDDLLDAVARGVTVETIKAEQQELPTT